jgi:hypothetical protein
MAKYTHHKILNQSIHEAIGYCRALASHHCPQLTIDDAKIEACKYYALTVVERYVFDGMLASSIAEKPLSIADPSKVVSTFKATAIADYTVAEIDKRKAEQLAEFEANQAKLQPQVDAANAKFRADLAANGQQMDSEGKISLISDSEEQIAAKKNSALLDKIAANNARLDELGANHPNGTLNSVVLADTDKNEAELTPQKAAAMARSAAKKAAK